MLTDNIKELNEQGYTIVKNLVDIELIDNIYNSVNRVFQKQADRTGCKDMEELKSKHYNLHNLCDLHSQWNLHGHYLQCLLGFKMAEFMTNPDVSINVRPIIYCDQYLPIKMRGSTDSLVCCVPLVTEKESGYIQMIPKKLDPDRNITYKVHTREWRDKDDKDWVSIDVPKGDILVFAHDVAHRHSKAKDGTLWYAYYTFNNMNDPAFVEAGYPHPYTDWTKRDYSDEHA